MASDSVDISHGDVTGTITGGSQNDVFEFNGGFGHETIADFKTGSASTHDTLRFASNDFGNFAAIQSAMKQVGSDVLVKLDAVDSIVLTNVTLASLVSADFKFV